MKKILGLFLFISAISFSSCNTNNENDDKVVDDVPATMTFKVAYSCDGNLLDLIDVEFHYYFTGKDGNDANNPIVEKITNSTLEKEFKNQTMDSELNYKIKYIRNDVAVDSDKSYDFTYQLGRSRIVYNAGGEELSNHGVLKPSGITVTGVNSDKIEDFIDSRNRAGYNTLSKSTAVGL